MRFLFSSKAVATVGVWLCQAVLAGTPASLAIAAGDNQTAIAGTAVSGVVCVVVRDASNLGVVGVTVTWGNVTGSGSITGETKVTDSSGVATLGSWTLGATPGINTITASAPGLNSVIFTATALTGPSNGPGAATRLAIAAGNNQIAASGAAVSGPVCAIVTDANNVPLLGVAVSFVVASGGGSITGENQITGSNGVVTLGSWTLGAPGVNTITATSTGLTPITFKATATGTATQLSIAAGNEQSALVGNSVSDAICVLATDANNAPVSGVTVTWTAEAKRGLVAGAVQVTDSTGIATLGGWTLGRKPGPCTVTATSPGLNSLTFTAKGVSAASNLKAARKLAPIADSDYYDGGSPNADKVKLGRFLFFDRILSANRDVSCATCHNPNAITGDGLSLSLGVGAQGLASARTPATTPGRVPRNATMLFNLGAKQFSHIFADGRVEVDPTQPNGVKSPAGVNLPQGLENVLAVQALFPLQSEPEMVSTAGSDPISNAAAVGNLAGPNGVWAQLVSRLRAIPEYVQLFETVYPSEIASANDITIVHAANAIAAFETNAYRADKSPFDQTLRGDRHAMSIAQLAGMKIFYGKGNCFACHSGVFQTDQKFHNIAMPQIGPGKGDGVDGHDDFGRQRVTKSTTDRFKFRTPSLRNVELTAPYGHDGAYPTLESVIQHHLDPVKALNAYDPKQAVLPSRSDLDALDFIAQSDASRRAQIAAGAELQPIALSSREVGFLVEFLKALTDPNSRNLQSDFPDHVPSGLSLDK